MSKVYTKTGDKGETSLVGGTRVRKTDVRLEAYGTVDELNANLAYLRDNILAVGGLDEELEELLWTQTRLMIVSALLASEESVYDRMPHIEEADVVRLERAIDRISARLEPLRFFVIPGGHPLVSLAHISRTVCRRAERASLRVAEETEVPQHALVFLNRLSDYLYVLGRLLSLKTETKELFWDGK